ncbi:hypothetical protein HJC23_007385 [Cyclotella cryptica]|uniref:C2H2-type domain-containing protein n=1 Tax=Cyclotella cryptica TaxID=29204 RepID=A0ABD3Q528_9STRA|eukprot:CCRYP_008721-RA/>CCRYP_008721-RA protein AED:0.14 eAED:0.14 QI:0/-1/0/1/-1/1/1/0/441
MPKPERGTPKDIANRMKAKGLQKLKFYCQMCSKQCRDENGFKCHITSDSHLRQMKTFRENAGGILDDFSREFESAYIETLRRRHGTQRMNANNVYQEVIQDKHHVHMNSTKWATLTDFVQYLGRRGICVVEETERGWYVTYIERDPALLARQEALRKKMEADHKEEVLAAERREMLRLEAAKALDRAGGVVDRVASEIGQREEGQGTIELKLGGGQGSGGQVGKKRKNVGKISLVEQDDEEDDNEEEKDDKDKRDVKSHDNNHQDSNLARPNDYGRSNTQSDNSKPTQKRRQDDQHNQNNSAGIKKPKSDTNANDDDNKKDYWLYRDIIVRIISKKLAKGEYYKRKAIVDKVIDKYEAEVEVMESRPKAKDGGDILRIDQDDLETVVPKDIGEKVRIVNGRWRGKKARVLKLDKANYKAELRLVEEDRVVVLDYEDFSIMA